VVALLLDTDVVDVDLQDNKGRTPIYLAAEDGNEAAVWLLLRTNRVDPYSEDSLGRTPLMIAEEEQREEVVGQLQTWTRLQGGYDHLAFA
jgi:ankyrin repeat protein